MLSEKNKRMATIIAGIVVAYYGFGLAKKIVFYLIIGALLFYFLDREKPEMTAGVKKKGKNLLDEKISEVIKKTLNTQKE
jgi:hypothetical protein